jgi:hypothetical protein
MSEEISFVEVKYGEDDDAIWITRLSKRVPYAVWSALVKAGATYKYETDFGYVYGINPTKARPVLEKYGYAVVEKSKREEEEEPSFQGLAHQEALGEVKDQ